MLLFGTIAVFQFELHNSPAYRPADKSNLPHNVCLLCKEDSVTLSLMRIFYETI